MHVAFISQKCILNVIFMQVDYFPHPFVCKLKFVMFHFKLHEIQSSSIDKCKYVSFFSSSSQKHPAELISLMKNSSKLPYEYDV